eukprot:jgi/Tetstr1/458663/TSEL_045054.t1
MLRFPFAVSEFGSPALHAEAFLGALHGACLLAKGGEEAVRKAIERSGRMLGGMKTDLLRLMDEDNWRYSARCICMADAPTKLCAGCKGAGFCSKTCQKK